MNMKRTKTGDGTRQSQTFYRNCNLCEAMCGVAIEVEDAHIISIKGDKSDPFSKGHICPKALGLKDFHEDPDRLKAPMVRSKNGWKEVSWSKAFDLVAKKVHSIQSHHGRDAVGLYYGNPNVHHLGNMVFIYPFIRAIDTKNRFAATSNDQLPHMRACHELFGHQLLLPVPDIDHTDLFILFGSNPAASNGSVMTAPDVVGRMKGIRKRGGEVVIVDPRKTETTRAADQHVFVKPGTDVFMLLGMLNYLFRESLIELGRLESHIDDLKALEALAEGFTPAKASELCGVDAQVIEELARKLATTPRAAMYGRMGTSTQEYGGLATWLIYVLNIVTNHLDERGGLMFTKPAADLIEALSWLGEEGHSGQYQSVNGLPEFNGELPCSAMADQIEQTGPKQIKAMIVLAGNPLRSSSNTKRLESAFDELEFLVSIDSYINETSSKADIILPPTSHLEQSHYDLVFNALSVRNVAKYSPPVFERAKHTRHDWEIMLELTRRIAGRSVQSKVQAEAFYRAAKMLGPDGALDLLLRAGPYGTHIPGTEQIGAFFVDSVQSFLSPKGVIRKAISMGPYGAENRGLSKGICVGSLMNYPHGIDLGSLQSALPNRLFTENKRIKLMPRSFKSALAELSKQAEHSEPSSQSNEFVLIGRRDVRSNNSWMHNYHRLVKGKSRCTAMIHPDSAAAIGVAAGAEIKIRSRVGEVQLEVELTPEIMPGVVSVPHGWGHDAEGMRLSVAQKYPGVNANLLTDDKCVDKLTGTAIFNGVPVSVEKVHAPEQTRATATKRKSQGTKAKKTTTKPRRRVAAAVD